MVKPPCCKGTCGVVTSHEWETKPGNLPQAFFEYLLFCMEGHARYTTGSPGHTPLDEQLAVRLEIRMSL